MKAFIFLALVASVAARSFDLETLHGLKKEKTLETPVVTKIDDLLLKEQNKNLVGEQQTLIGSTILPVQDKTVFGDNVVDTEYTHRVLSFEEIYNTELFREYLTIPLFRQNIQYPSFQRFVASVYFQKFWQLPAYKQYFINPVLFYKYVYPIVQLFNTEYNVPTEYGQNTEDVLGLGYLLKNKNYLPYAYNYNRFTVPTAFPETTNYKFLLEKLYKNLIPQQQQFVDVKTDVKLIPTEKAVVEPKIVDVKVEEQIVPFDKIQTESAFLTEKDVYLLKELLVKKFITPEVYEAVIYGKINFVTVLRQILARGQIEPELYTQIVGRLQVIDTVVPTSVDNILSQRHLVVLKDLVKKSIITPEIYKAVVYGQVDFVTVIRQVLARRGLPTELVTLIVNRFVNLDFYSTQQDKYLVRELLKYSLITPEIYQAVVYGQADLYDILYQIIVRRDVDYIYPVTRDFDTTVFPYSKVNYGNDFFSKYYGNQYNKYNTEIPTIRDTTFNYNRY
jgi:hypothetical protein